MSKKVTIGKVRPDTRIFCGPGRTKQEFKDEVNINKIIARYRVEGKFPNSRPPPTMDHFGDFPDVEDYLDAIQTMEKAKEQFQSLPSGVRDRFGHSVSSFLQFVRPENLEALHDMGLLGEEGKKKVDELRKARAPRSPPEPSK